MTMKLTDLNLIEPVVRSITRIDKGNCLDKGVSYGKRIVKYYEIDYITWGDGYMITDGKKIQVQKGQLFFREPGMVVEGIGPYHCYFFTLDLFDGVRDCEKDDYIENGMEIQMFRNIDVDERMIFEKLLNDLYKAYIQETSMSAFVIKAGLMQIFLLLYNMHLKEEQSKKLEGRKNIQSSGIDLVIEMVEANPGASYKIDELAFHAGYNSHYFCRLFKRVTGVTPITYVNRCRLSYIRRELIETKKSVKTIILESGIENEAYFFRLFKKHTGTTPIEYRKRHREMYV